MASRFRGPLDGDPALAGSGASFAGYRVDSLVGRGGMGVVYRATDVSLDRRVALKLIAPELAEDPRLRARFLKEQRLAASLEHPMKRIARNSRPSRSPASSAR